MNLDKKGNALIILLAAVAVLAVAVLGFVIMKRTDVDDGSSMVVVEDKADVMVEDTKPLAPLPQEEEGTPEGVKNEDLEGLDSLMKEIDADQNADDALQDLKL
ncbi:hypothetical protein H6802_01105 [Candidatus Nomurabacteria bacterium]|uniref:Uncharacterized protein n=1 Tax=candidate division WWE3 bacterium TaxID=2053526 RepID=A0A955IW77_UNCKA|nr:hypothetical protein [candidate division WWE3 bacterium]MCB9823541.1 hypothetical protein [Candidatus Nomurabacteria bacterium]MCB9827336.1 hypothetical protein [Candidatus Nomurabacteria bacterium]HXK52492.1 hypothetical protein [bacterium]